MMFPAVEKAVPCPLMRGGVGRHEKSVNPTGVVRSKRLHSASPPTKRLLVRFRQPATMAPMRSLKLLLLVLLAPFSFTATVLADENKASLTYYYFDG